MTGDGDSGVQYQEKFRINLGTHVIDSGLLSLEIASNYNINPEEL